MNSEPRKKKTTSKQIAAIVGVAVLALLYLVTLIVAATDNSQSGRWFMICIFATVAVPLLLWIYIWIYGKLTGRHTIADAQQTQEDEACETGTASVAETASEAEAASVAETASEAETASVAETASETAGED